jgi:hypothetical protein
MFGGALFFTGNVLEHHENLLLTQHIDILRDAVVRTRNGIPV